jgi:alkylation response protein AidB-like acyl-CoA dehydrogenase
MTTTSLLLEGKPFEACQGFFESRAAANDRGETDFREAGRFLWEGVLSEGTGPNRQPNADLTRVASTLATVSWFDMGSAFSLWCQRMVLEYLSKAPDGSAAFAEALPAVRRGERLGATALAGPLAHYVSGAPMTLRAERDGDGYRVNGPVPWASNLAPGETIVVSAATREGETPVIFATPTEVEGISQPPFEPLVAMQGTLSSSLTLENVYIPREWVVSEDFAGFMRSIRPTFLLLQSSYSWGLAARCLSEAKAGIRGVTEVFREEIDVAQGRASRLADVLSGAAASACATVEVRDLVEARLEAATLAVDAAGLESRVAGGRSYIASCDTARRLREALFLPVQAPTEGQLRWERSQSV